MRNRKREKVSSLGKLLGVTASAAMIAALTACGSDNNAGTSATGGEAAGTVDCGGKKSLKASGSTAQANAMTRFVTAYEAACAGFTLNYTSSGSGAGVSEFVGGQTDIGGSDSPLNPDKGEVERAAARCG
ncbi:substrate-binding domain-containing protein, partial [Mycolicibacterium sp.]|uniref:substrate-binding domain-containing protein n=1 Tax=Mycolicibacterium sp. TaxID=2320850 RepID=UPI0028B062F7